MAETKRSTVYNKIVTPEKVERINGENKELVNDFVIYLKATDKSPATIKQYINDLNIFFVWNLESNKNKLFIDIKKREIVRFQQESMVTWGWSPKRVRRMRSVLSSFSTYIENILDEEYEDFRNIISKIEPPPNSTVREKTVITKDKIDLLLKVLTEKEQFEKACVVAIFAYSGMRKSELIQMKTKYFTDDRIIFDAMFKTDKIRSKGKGEKGKLINKYILLKAKPYVDAWLDKREKLGIDSEWLFARQSNGCWIQRKTIDYWMKEFGEIIDMDLYPHSFRHFTCTLFSSEYNLPAEIVKEFFSWESTDMISIYNDKDMTEDFGIYFSPTGIVKQEKKELKDLN